MRYSDHARIHPQVSEDDLKKKRQRKDGKKGRVHGQAWWENNG